MEGTLIANGATFTSWHDDTAGGDSNANGNATSPMPGDRGGVDFGRTALNATLDTCTFRYGGGTTAGGAMLSFRSATVTLRGSRIEHSSHHGIDMGVARSVVDNCRIDDCGGLPITNVRADVVPKCRRSPPHGTPAAIMH